MVVHNPQAPLRLRGCGYRKCPASECGQFAKMKPREKTGVDQNETTTPSAAERNGLLATTAAVQHPPAGPDRHEPAPGPLCSSQPHRAHRQL